MKENKIKTEEVSVRPEILVMKKRIHDALSDQGVSMKVESDFTLTFIKIGLTDADAKSVTRRTIESLRQSEDLEKTEAELYRWYGLIHVDGVSLIEVLEQKIKGRAELVFSQIAPYFEATTSDANKKTKPAIMDFGCGDGLVSDLLSRHLKCPVSGADVKNYLAPNVHLPWIQINDQNQLDCVDGLFDYVLLTNVIHHEANNQALLREVARITKPGGRVVVIETVPTKDTYEAFEVNFMNDYLYNRLFHQADVPVPGAYETAEKWPERFASVGLELEGDSLYTDEILSKSRTLEAQINTNHISGCIHLGFDQECILDWHVFYVLKKTEDRRFKE